MIVLDPESIGCGRKVPPSSLVGLQVAFSKAMGDRPRSSDFAVSSLAQGGTLVSSIDRTSRFTDANDVFVAAALAHAANDVLCGRSMPSVASVGVGLTRKEFESDGGVAVATSIASVMKKMNLSPGKLHTFIDYESSLTVAVSGERTMSLPSRDQEMGGPILLTKPLGAMKVIYLSSIGHEIEQLDPAVNYVGRWDGQLIQRLLPFVVALTDVSGFGLVHALDQLMASEGLIGDLDSDRLPLISDVVDTIPVDCLDKGRGASTSALSIVGNSELSRGYVSEVNGPIALLVSDRLVAEVLPLANGTILYEVGRWRR